MRPGECFPAPSLLCAEAGQCSGRGFEARATAHLFVGILEIVSTRCFIQLSWRLLWPGAQGGRFKTLVGTADGAYDLGGLDSSPSAPFFLLRLAPVHAVCPMRVFGYKCVTLFMRKENKRSPTLCSVRSTRSARRGAVSAHAQHARALPLGCR